MRNDSEVSKKQSARRALEEARRACSIIPDGQIHDFENPDFKIETASGPVGVELTEVLPPADNDTFSSPVVKNGFLAKAVHLAEQEYNRAPGAIPVKVRVYFSHIESDKYDKRVMARSLAEFVRSHRERAAPVATFRQRDNLPEGFGVISISAGSGPWGGGESLGFSLAQIYLQIGERIKAKDKLLPTYRSNLPGAPIWLLIHSGVQVSKSIPIPRGFAKWTFPFQFDRALYFCSLDNEVEELRRE
jgi:hypothetical protein